MHLTVWITTNLKILKEMGIPDHLTCLLRNLYAGQEVKLELDMEQQTGSKWEKEYVKAVRLLLFFSRSWCTQGFVCALQESVSPVLCKFHNQIPLSSKFELPGGSQSLCQIPRFGNLLWVLKLSFLFFSFFRTFLTV